MKNQCIVTTLLIVAVIIAFVFHHWVVLGCGCQKVMDQENILSQLGVATHKFDEIGEFTYCLLHQGNSDTVSGSHCCSVVVERTAKVTY